MYSTLTNALNLAQAENGGLEGCFIETDDNAAKTQYFYDKCLKDYLKVQKVCQPVTDDCWDMTNFKSPGTGKGYCATRMRNDRNKDRAILLADGTSMFLWTAGVAKEAGFCIDTNGSKKKPNKMGRDAFMIYINADKNSPTLKYGTFMYGAFYKIPLTRQELLEGDEGCNKESTHGYAGSYCGALIQRDGWEIKDDYPW